MPLTSFTPSTKIQSSQVNANFSGLADGSLMNNPTITTPTLITPVIKTAYANGNLGATPTINWANGDLQTGVLSANTTIAFSNAVAGQRLTLFMQQNGTGTYTIAWTPSITWQDGSAWATTNYTTTANKWNVVVILYTGTEYIGLSSKFA